MHQNAKMAAIGGNGTTGTVRRHTLLHFNAHPTDLHKEPILSHPPLSTFLATCRSPHYSPDTLFVRILGRAFLGLIGVTRLVRRRQVGECVRVFLKRRNSDQDEKSPSSRQLSATLNGFSGICNYFVYAVFPAPTLLFFPPLLSFPFLSQKNGYAHTG